MCSTTLSYHMKLIEPVCNNIRTSKKKKKGEKKTHLTLIDNLDFIENNTIIQCIHAWVHLTINDNLDLIKVLPLSKAYKLGYSSTACTIFVKVVLLL